MSGAAYPEPTAWVWAAEKRPSDPRQRARGYFGQNPLTREFLAWNTERAMRLYDEGSLMLPFKGNAQDDYASKWKASPDAAPLRNFARRLFGPTFCAKVLGIAAANE